MFCRIMVAKWWLGTSSEFISVKCHLGHVEMWSLQWLFISSVALRNSLAGLWAAEID